MKNTLDASLSASARTVKVGLVFEPLGKTEALSKNKPSTPCTFRLLSHTEFWISVPILVVPIGWKLGPQIFLNSVIESNL